MKRTPLARKTPLRARSRKSTPARQSARGMDCTLRFRGCENDTATVVLCHLRMFGGGGTGIKPPDTEAVYGCAYCHDVLDGRKPMLCGGRVEWEDIARALVRTHRRMAADGILILKGEVA